MLIEDVYITNMDRLYEIIRKHYTHDNWTSLMNDNSLFNMLSSVSVTFDIKDISITEYIFLHELTDHIIITREPLLKQDNFIYTEELNSVINELIKIANHRVIHSDETLDEKLYRVFTMLPSGSFDLNVSVTFTGSNLSTLMDYNKPAGHIPNTFNENIELSSKVGNISILEAQQIPVVRFFMETLKQTEDSTETVYPMLEDIPSNPNSKTWIHFLPWKEDYLNQIKNSMIKNLIRRIYTIISKYKNVTSVYEQNIFNNIPNTDIQSVSTPFGNIEFGSTTVESDFQRINENIKSLHTLFFLLPESGTRTIITEKSSVRVYMKIMLIEYMYLLRYIPYKWIHYVSLPDYDDGLNFMKKLANKPNMNTNDISDILPNITIPENWNVKNRFMDIYISLGKMAVMATERKELGNIILNMLNPMCSTVKMMLNIPIIEGVAILPESITATEHAHSVYIPSTKKILLRMVDCVKSAYTIITK